MLEPLDTAWARRVSAEGTARLWELSRELAACPAPGEGSGQHGDVTQLLVAVRCPGSEARCRAGSVEQGGGTEPGLAGLGPAGPAAVGTGPTDAVPGWLGLDSPVTNACPSSGMTPGAVEPIPATVAPAGLGPSGWKSRAEAAGTLLPGHGVGDSVTAIAVPSLSPSLCPEPGCPCREVPDVRVAAVPVPRLCPPAPAPGVTSPCIPGEQPEERRSPHAVPRVSPTPRWEAAEPGAPQVTAARAPRP